MDEPHLDFFTWEVTDTPGFGDPEGSVADEVHFAEIIGHLQNSQRPPNVIALVLQFGMRRFTPEIQKALAVFNSVFNNPHMWDQVCIIATSTPGKPNQSELDAWNQSSRQGKCFCDCLRDLLHGLWDWTGTDPEFPVFCVNSRKPH
jgi:hypothetical protein